MVTKAQVVLFTRPGCHLCEDAKAAIFSAQCADEYTLEEVNIDSSPELLEKYKYEIPVITIDGVEAFRHRLTPKAFRNRIQNR